MSLAVIASVQSICTSDTISYTLAEQKASTQQTPVPVTSLPSKDEEGQLPEDLSTVAEQENDDYSDQLPLQYPNLRRTSSKVEPVHPLRVDTDQLQLPTPTGPSSVGSTTTNSKRRLQRSTPQSGLSPPIVYNQSPRSPSITFSTVPVDLCELESDDGIATEPLERHSSKRLQTRQRGWVDSDESDDDFVAIGTRVAEGHRNYYLMYDMLTGIRIAVGRVSAKMRRELTPEDFKAAHKLVFDLTGNELTPGVKYDFKFKDYAPWVFRNLREQFHIDAADYMMSLTNKYILSELGSPGKSGSFFYYSRDYRFIIKTIHYSEHKFMRRILKRYYDHICCNPNTLLCRFYGLHRIKLPHGRKVHFVVMGNVFPPNKNIHETYDLKGSTFGRLTPVEELEKNSCAVMKDLNWVKGDQRLFLGPEKRQALIGQLEQDIDFLRQLNIMDYSLLVGIHDLKKGNTEGFHEHHLQMVESHTQRPPSQRRVVRRSLKHTDPHHPEKIHTSTPEDRRSSLFYSEHGGFKSTNVQNEETDYIYYMGVIDILTPYSLVKKVEHLWKSVTQDKLSISSVNPMLYGERFLAFMDRAICDDESKVLEDHVTYL